MPKLKKSIEVAVPVRVAYDQWTQFEEFPRFMEGVESVKQLDDRRLRWRANVAGKVEEWDAEIVEQTPDRVISWRSTSGARRDEVKPGMHASISIPPAGLPGTPSVGTIAPPLAR